MSRIDDVRELAEKAMGWAIEESNSDQWHLCILRSDGSDTHWVTPEGPADYFSWPPSFKRFWDPFTDANAALGVVEAMRANRGILVRTWQQADGTWKIWLLSLKGGKMVGDEIMTQPTFCEAICAAALAVVRSENVRID